MSDKKFSVVGIGNAIVDVIANVDDDFLITHSIKKGNMKLICKDEAELLYGKINVVEEIPGGSAANTIAGLASFGSKVAFIGKVRNDPLGEKFENGLKGIGVNCNTKKVKAGMPTGRCVVLITPDAQRTMNTFLGISETLGEDDINEEVISDSEVTYLEGYLWDSDKSKKAFLKAIDTAHNSGGKVALSLSDSFCVDSHRDEFLDLVKNYIDILFANEDEIKSLFRVKSFESAVDNCKDLKIICTLTRSEKGSVITSGGRAYIIKVVPPTAIVDTTGAGDLYAAGFLHGFTKGSDLYTCGRIGSIAASEVISHFGARPGTPLARLIGKKTFRF